MRFGSGAGAIPGLVAVPYRWLSACPEIHRSRSVLGRRLLDRIRPACPSIDRMSLPAELDPGLRLRGRVLEWHATKGCGFAEDGRGRIFIHIRDFAERHTKPCVGDAITYSRGTDQKGRPCAKQICQVNDGGRLRPRDFFVLGVLLCTPALALWRVAPPALGGALVVTALLASVASYLFYAWDKSRARARAWRLLGWRLSRSAFAELGAWVEGLNADSRERAPARF
jgi:cold shock CspA family protein